MPVTGTWLLTCDACRGRVIARGAPAEVAAAAVRHRQVNTGHDAVARRTSA